MPSVDEYELTAGDIIRGARAANGLDVADVAAQMRISPELLLNVEDGIFNGAVPAYLMNNIVRDYAIFLGLDAIEIRALYWKEVEPAASNPSQAQLLLPRPTPQKLSNVAKFMSFFGFGPKT